MNSNKLSVQRSDSLQRIFENYRELAVCYSMKEEMNESYNLKDSVVAEEGRKKWFTAARESCIPALIKFAYLKEKYIPGLVAHAIHMISTGKPEGFNNKTKVAKRLGSG